MMLSPSYQWQYLPSSDRLCLTGPLARAPHKRRNLALSLGGCPDTVRNSFLFRPTAGSAVFAHTLSVGKRPLLVVHTAADCGILVDLSGQERRLKQVSRYASAIQEGIDALPEAFVLYDSEDRLLIANPQYSALYPSIADIAKPGARFTDIVHTSVARGQMQFHNESAEDWIQRRLAFHRAGVGFFEQHLATGQWMRVSERRTASGGITSIRAEITPLKDREQALQRATAEAQKRSQSLTRFLAIFSHEIRNGLNGIVGLAHDPIKLLYTEHAVLIGMVSVLLPYLIITLQSVIENIDPALEEAALGLGATYWHVFTRILLPLTMPGIIVGSVLGFILAMNAYATPLLIGGATFHMMAPQVYTQISLANNWPFGAAMAFVLMFTTLALTLASSWLMARYSATARRQ